MKIAVLAFSFLPHLGGAQIFTYNLIRHLQKRGHAVHLLVPFYWYRRYKALALQDGLTIHPICCREMSLLDRFPGIISFSLTCRQLIARYDIWQVIGSYPAGYVAGSLADRVPLVLRSYGQDIQKDESIGYGDRLQSGVEQKIKHALSRMTRLVALTPTVTRDYAALGVPNNKIIEIPNGVDLERFRSEVDRERVRRQYGIADDEVLLLSIGRYHKKKGYELIPETAQRLIERGCKVRWLLVGNGVERIAHLACEKNLKKMLIFQQKVVSWQTDSSNEHFGFPSRELIEIYKAADVFVMPSLLETFGMVLIEAMAAGVPVVTTDAPGCRDVVEHNQTGLLSEPASPVSLADNIEKVITDTGLRQKLLSRSQTKVAEFDWPNIAAAYEKLYCEILDA